MIVRKKIVNEGNEWNKYPINNETILEQVNLWKYSTDRQKQVLGSQIILALNFLVENRIKQYNGKRYYDDLLNEGRLGLLQALEKFNPERGPNFFKYAIWLVCNRIRNYLNWEKKFSQRIPRGYEIVPTPLEILEQKENIYFIQTRLSRLNKKMRQIIEYRYGLDDGRRRSLEEIAGIYNISRERVRQIEKSAMKMLKRES